MTFKKRKDKDKKRSTPKDVENRKRGIYPDKKDPKTPRKATPNEIRGSNEAAWRRRTGSSPRRRC